MPFLSRDHETKEGEGKKERERVRVRGRERGREIGAVFAHLFSLMKMTRLEEGIDKEGWLLGLFESGPNFYR